jgi:hypothetical protein
MKIEEIIFILENRIKNLEQQKNAAVMVGDLEMVTAIDIQIVETQISLDSIKKSL